MDDLEVAALAPRLFAIVEEADDDERVAAWGLDFGDGVAEVAAPEGCKISTTSAERALWFLQLGMESDARLVWVESGVNHEVKT